MMTYSTQLQTSPQTDVTEAMSGLERLAEMMENPVGDDDTDRGRHEPMGWSGTVRKLGLSVHCALDSTNIYIYVHVYICIYIHIHTHTYIYIIYTLFSYHII